MQIILAVLVHWSSSSIGSAPSTHPQTYNYQALQAPELNFFLSVKCLGRFPSHHPKLQQQPGPSSYLAQEFETVLDARGYIDHQLLQCLHSRLTLCCGGYCLPATTARSSTGAVWSTSSAAEKHSPAPNCYVDSQVRRFPRGFLKY
jgi:hypothetical protein